MHTVQGRPWTGGDHATSFMGGDPFAVRSRRHDRSRVLEHRSGSRPAGTGSGRGRPPPADLSTEPHPGTTAAAGGPRVLFFRRGEMRNVAVAGQDAERL